jgi:hypothetical protein
MRTRVHVELENLPIPRVWGFLSPGADDDPDSLALGLELSSRYGEPVVDVSIALPWRRPRPWALEGTWPSKWGGDRFVWRWNVARSSLDGRDGSGDARGGGRPVDVPADRERS